MIKRDSASFRDPAGHVYWQEDTIYRTVMPSFAQAFDTVRQTGAINNWIEKGLLWPEERVPTSQLACADNAYALLKHPRLPLISYPYEWPFSMLKDAALFHLDLMLDALSHDIILNDASAFNIQFDGFNPIFIDHLAFRPYLQGEYWQAHKQFFEQFINPLLLQAYCGIPFQGWYRGNLNGLTTDEIAKILPFKYRFNWHVFFHIMLQAHFDKAQRPLVAKASKQVSMPKQGLQRLWQSLRKWVDKLQDKTPISHWQSYVKSHSYENEQFAMKKKVISELIAKTKPALVWDLGCNIGIFSELALQAGAKRVIGFDNDHSALAIAYNISKKNKLAFTPLFMDMTNPSPAQGWDEKERASLTKRQTPNVVLALALIHHLAISSNIPLFMIVDWLTTLAPLGVIEFIPKTDPMVQLMLSQRQDIFADYSIDMLINLLSKKANIISRISLSAGGRELICFERIGSSC